MAITLLAFAARLLAATEDDGDPWSTVSKQVIVGKVTLQLTNQEIHATGSNLNITLSWRMPKVSDYVCAVRNPFAQPKLEDGEVVSDANFQVLESYDDFKASTFPRFAFFTNRPTTIGLMTGHAAANGGSDEKLLLADVETGAHVLIPLDGGEMPQWLAPTNYPPVFVTRCDMGYKGWNQSCVGQAYRFTGGTWQRDVTTEQRMMAAMFQKVQLTRAQRKALRAADSTVLDDWGAASGLAQAVGDFIYYGTRTGHHPQVDALLDTLPAELRRSLAELRHKIYSESRANVVSGMVAPAPDPLGDGVTAPRYEQAVHVAQRGETIESIARKWGVTVKSLKDNNPALLQGRLKVGQRLSLYEFHPMRAVGLPAKESFPGTNPELAQWGIQTGLYTVKPGDAGFRIAKNFNLTLKALEEANPGEDWRRLKVGQSLMIPGYGWNWEKPQTFSENTDVNDRDFTVVHWQLGLKVKLFTYVGRPEPRSWQQERGNVWSLTYFAGDPGTQYFFSIIRKAVFNVRTRELLADMDFRYENLNGPGQLPPQPRWTWTTNALVINVPEDGPPVTIPSDKMQ
jgi:LysM repeat protein